MRVRSAGERSPASVASAAPPLCGCNWTTETMRYFTVRMGWLTDWRRRRVLAKHRIDDALWARATTGLEFLPRTAKLRELVLLFLAEKEFTGTHGLQLTDEMRVSIAAQACLP